MYSAPLITSVITDILGKSGRAFLEAIIAGETDPGTLAALANHRLRAKCDEIVEPLRGRVTPHHRFLLRLHLDQIGALEKSIARVEEELDTVLGPFRAKAELPKTMSGVSDTVAEVVVAEVGVDMTRFPTAGHLISWAGLCPRSDESAAKRRSTRLRKATPWLKTTLVQAAWAAARSKGTYLNAQFLRLRARRGPKKAVVAVAASMLTSAYYMLRDDRTNADLGGQHFDNLNKAKDHHPTRPQAHRPRLPGRPQTRRGRLIAFRVRPYSLSLSHRVLSPIPSWAAVFLRCPPFAASRRRIASFSRSLSVPPRRRSEGGPVTSRAPRPRSPAAISAPSARMAALSRTFPSSRTFPGQA